MNRSPAPGSRLGSYEILSLLGEGGMGAVYRARDTRLKRDVAIKVLLPEVADDPDRIARFEREAQLLATLNHANIAAIYGVEQAADLTALVLEYVEGPTLADRIARGPIPLDEALPIARQIAAALEAAHEQGIVHRDLKPANIKVRDDGTVKVLDFGLAKALEKSESPGRLDLSASPTITSPAMTQVGIILGTAAYMSPEQARGRAVDRRVDIWAFGCVLYEMVTGERLFQGEDLTDTLAAIVRDQPDVSRAAPQLHRLLRKCLEKDPKRRLRDLGDAWDLLDDANVSRAARVDDTVGKSPRLAWLGWTVALLAITVAGWMFVAARRTPAASQGSAPTTWLTLALPDDLPLIPNTLHRSAVITPDGTSVVYLTRDGLAVRRLDSAASTLLPGTAGGRAPFVSLDGQRVGFISETSEVGWVPIRGGPFQRLVGATDVGTGGFQGATFLPDGGVVFATAAGTGLMRLPPGGQSPERLTSVNAGRSERLHQWPTALPNGRGVLFTVSSGLADRPTLEVAVLDLRTGSYRILASGSQPAYVDGGYLTFVQDGHLFAAGFDDERLELTSAPASVVERVSSFPQGAAEYSVSRLGTLVFLGGVLDVARSLVWIDWAGHETALAVPRLNYVYPRVSPDGLRVALDIRTSSATSGYIAVYDIPRKTLTRLSLGFNSGQYPVWLADSRRILYQAVGVGVMSQSLDGGAAVKVGPVDAPLSVDPSGRHLVLGKNTDGIRWLGVTTLGAPADELPLLRSSTAWIVNGEISPDGRFLAFQSSEPGRFEVFVVPFPEVTSARWQVSTAGGTRPVWARDGKELYFLNLSGALMRVPTSVQPTFSAGTPEKLFDSAAALTGFPPGRNYDVAPDGRFLMVKDSFVNATRPVELTIAINWIAEVKSRLLMNP